MASHAPLVSICMPVLNGRPFLRQRMESIEAQTLEDWELVVCDSHSDDGSWEYMKSWEGSSRVQLHQVPRQGVYAGWNECLERARGKYIHIAAADDVIEPDFLDRTVGMLERYPDVDLAVTQFKFIDEHDRRALRNKRRLDALYEEWIHLPHRRHSETDILIHFCVGIPWTTASALVFRSSLLGKVGLFRTDYGSEADGLWALRASMHSDCISIPERLASWRRHANQASATHDRNWWQRNAAGLGETVDSCADRIPSSWRNDPTWRMELLRVARSRALQSYGIDRAALRRDPGKFCGSCAHALLREPAFLARRLLSGLAWDTPDFVEEYDQLHHLIEKWKVSRQPEVLQDALWAPT